MSFRSDINGLRAIAVLSVLLYHFGIRGFGGGYVGVDVFFVISGFLMTQIIFTRLAKDFFSLPEFYIARSLRILPALAAVIAFLLIAGAIYMPLTEYKFLGRRAISALTFVSNIVFSHKGDYFDTSSQEKWPLHTWSLSVEWQFYLILPLCMMWLHKFRKGAYLKRAVIAVFAASLLLAVVGTPLYPTESFFLLPTRAWEFMAGALVFFYGVRLQKIPFLTEAGLLCILVAVCFYSSELDFPGFWAVLPALGAALVIAAQSKGPLLGNRAAQFFGEISYSLYLWHWPVMVGARYFDVPFTWLNVTLLIGLVILMSKASCVFVEEPFRHMKKSATRRKVLLTGAGGYVLIALLSWLVFFFDGLPARVPADVLAIEAATEVKSPRHGNCSFEYKKVGVPQDCLIGADVPPTAAVWGNSHSDAASFAMGQLLTDAKRSALLYSYAGCPPVLGTIFSAKWKKSTCLNINQATYDRTIADPRVRDVFLISRWSVYLYGFTEKGGPHPLIVFKKDMDATAENLAEREKQYTAKIIETMCALTSHGKNVYAVAPVPEIGRNVPSALAKSRLLYHRDSSVDITVEEYDRRNAVVLAALHRAAKECHVRVLEPKPYFCNAKACFGVKDGKALYNDDDHLSEAGNKILKPLLAKVFRQP